MYFFPSCYPDYLNSTFIVERLAVVTQKTMVMKCKHSQYWYFWSSLGPDFKWQEIGQIMKYRRRQYEQQVHSVPRFLFHLLALGLRTLLIHTAIATAWASCILLLLCLPEVEISVLTLPDSCGVCFLRALPGACLLGALPSWLQPTSPFSSGRTSVCRGHLLLHMELSSLLPLPQGSLKGSGKIILPPLMP